MRYLKMVLFVLITLFNSISAAFAEDKTALAIEYLEPSKTQESLDASIDTYVNQLSSSNPEIDKDQLRAFLNSYMEREIIGEQPINIMADTFTEDELKAINDFYKSKYGITDADICITPGTLEAHWCQYE
jgi:hypothetical protein